MPTLIDSRATRRALPLWDEAALRAAEAHWAARLPSHALMDRAGAAAAALLRARWPHARKVLLLCGPGNNGGDGLTCAAYLARQAHAPRVHVLLVGGAPPARAPMTHRGGDAQWALAQAQGAGLQMRAWSEVDAQAVLGDSDVVVDAMLGLGLREAPRGELAAAIEAVAADAGKRPLLALDVPSGLRGADGSAPGACVRATATLAMLGLQPGHACGARSPVCGELWLDELQVDPAAAGASPVAWLGGSDALLAALPALETAAHKGERGDVLLFGGASGMGGALWLAARAALQLGAGRVYAAAFDPRAPSLDPCHAELMLRAPAHLLEQARKARGASCLVFGPGAGDSDEALRVLLELLRMPQALVIDADGLNLLAAQAHDGIAWQALRERRAPCWLTPHPTEAARLLGVDTAQVQSDRLRAARELAAAAGCRVLLKGAGSVLAGPGEAPWINASGNGLLASAGTGDVLAGALGACLARSEASAPAARAAVWLHGAGADVALREGAALRAGTLPQWMQRAWHEARTR